MNAESSTNPVNQAVPTESNQNGSNESEPVDVYKLKFDKLYQRCEQIQLDNERLINHIYQAKKYTQRYQRQRIQLMKRLDKWKDGYREATYALFEELPAKVDTKPAGKSKANGVASKKKLKNCGHNPPKKPINPYLLFCQENRSSIQEKHTATTGIEMNNQELTKALAQKWHDLSSQEKQVYYDLYEREKERYEIKVKAFNEQQKLLAQQQQSANS